MSFRILALIAARSGSVGYRHKNIKRLGGVPLLARAVHLAKRSQRKHESWSIVVSTDSPYYKRIAEQAGAEVPFLRPLRLAQSKSRLIDTVLHAVDATQHNGTTYDAVLLLSAATPLTLESDVRGALRMFRRGGGVSVASVVRDPFDDSWRFSLVDGCLDRVPRVHRVSRRQEGEKRLVLNGAIYIASPDWLRRYRQFVQCGKTKPFVMPRSRSLDIDTRDDFVMASALADAQEQFRQRSGACDDRERF